MTARTSNRMPTGWSCTRIVCFRRLALHSLFLLVVPLLPTGASGFGLLRASEGEAPVGQEDHTEVAPCGSQDEKLERQALRHWRLLTPSHATRRTLDVAKATGSGHRLPNNLMAPLRC